MFNIILCNIYLLDLIDGLFWNIFRYLVLDSRGMYGIHGKGERSSWYNIGTLRAHECEVH